METIEHFAKISLVARLLGRENLIAREEVARLQELRGTYGIKAPAPICEDPPPPGEDATCQVVDAPAGGGLRLVADLLDSPFGDVSPKAGDTSPKLAATADGEEIRLTYRELSSLIEEAIRSLR
jgi:L-fuculose-phosphate aldolase